MTTITNSSDAHIIESSRHLVYERRYRAAFDMLAERLDEYPDDQIARYEHAVLCMTLDRDDELNADLRTLMSKPPRTAVEFDAYASAMALKGFTGPMSDAEACWKRAAAAFEQSIQRDPNRADVYRHRAQMHLWRDNHRAEAADLDRALALTPDDIDLLWRRASARKDMGDAAGAWADVNTMIRLEPNNPLHYRNRQLFRENDDNQGSLEDYNRILELTPSDVKTLNDRALLYTIMEQRGLALQDYDRVLQLEPNDKDALVWSAYALADTGSHQAAVERFSRVIALEPEHGAWYGHRAKSYRALGDLAAAEADEQRAARFKSTGDSVSSASSSADQQYGVSQPDQPGFVQFLSRYWLAWAWLALALFTLVILILVVSSYSSSGHVNSAQASLLAFGVIGALYRSFRNGFRFRRESAITDGGLTGIALNLVLWGVQIAIATAVWPFFELFRQGTFLVRAWNGWKKGQILVNDGDKPARGG